MCASLFGKFQWFQIPFLSPSWTGPETRYAFQLKKQIDHNVTEIDINGNLEVKA